MLKMELRENLNLWYNVLTGLVRPRRLAAQDIWFSSKESGVRIPSGSLFNFRSEAQYRISSPTAQRCRFYCQLKICERCQS